LTDVLQHTFEALRNKFVRRIQLIHPNEQKGWIINSDAIGCAIGSVLLDDSEDGELDIISTALSVLNQSEQLYTTWEKKFRAIVCALQLFRIYFYGRNLIIYTDNKTL
jgi:hypothetical protein